MDHPRAKSILLFGHAFVVGIGWFVVGLPLTLMVFQSPTLGTALEAAARAVPFGLTAGVVAVVALFAFPYMWPVWMVVGGYEARLAVGIRRGDERAGTAARWLLVAQGAMYLLVAAGLVRVTNRLEAMAVPLSIAAVHLAFARWMSPLVRT